MVTAKFACTKVEVVKDATGQPESYNVTLSAVVDGSAENKEFFRWTPSGQLTLGVVNLSAGEQFTEGAEYYLDIRHALPPQEKRHAV